MKLIELQICGYKCFKNDTIIPIQNLSILIGENDSGKSSILKALELLLSKRMPNDEDYFSLNNETQDNFWLKAKFEITDTNNKGELSSFLINNEFILKKTFKRGEAFKTFVMKTTLQDAELENYLTLDAATTKQLLVKLNIDALSNQDERKEAIKNYIVYNWNALPKQPTEIEINFNSISHFLPIYQYYGSHDYGNPISLVTKTLNNIYSSHFYNEAGELKIKSLKNIKQKILLELNKNVEENLLEKIKLYNSKVSNIQGRLDIDFSRGLDFQGLELDEGNGFKIIEQKGEGSKKRLFLSILEWDKEVQIGLTNNRAIIRAYDEPDSNLHYEAQRKMFNAISDVTNNKKSNTQSIIATHSIAMIDRAPSSSIIHVIQESGISQIDFLRTGNDQDISDFLSQISVIGGIKNSSIFYEKCFLLVEGDSEETAIPKIYKKLFDRTLTENGIVIINLQSNGAWFNFLKLLNKNKSSCTVMLLDTDTQNANCGANVTVNKLNEIGFDANFMANNIFFAGVQEFEDVFPDNRIRDVFNRLYPRPTKGKWTLKHIRKLRSENQKISKGFDKETLFYIDHHKRRYRKPEFANELANIITKKELENIPILNDLFAKVHQIIA